MLCTTADASPAAGDNMFLAQRIEGQNLQTIRKGTSSAKQLTISFWAKSNVTGTYIAELYESDNTRSVSKSYTVSASGTWEYKTLTFPADTAGVLDNDNDVSMQINFWLGAGTDFTSGTLATSWASSTNANRAVGQTNLAAATDNYWQITGVQLEVGSTATEFEFKPIDVELAQCQRYYYKNGGDALFAELGLGMASSTVLAAIRIFFPVTMRAVPNVINYSTVRLSDEANGYTVTNLVIGQTTNKNIAAVNATSTGLTQFRPHALQASNSLSGYVALGAEL